jgi:hypothetical protein
MWEENLKKYNEIVAQADRFERKGKTMPNTSANGYMFSLLNKAGQIGIRLPKSEQETFINVYESGPFYSHGAKMKDYVLIPNELLDQPEKMLKLLDLAYDFVSGLPTK